jgi:GT2 family glycosyltransferase
LELSLQSDGDASVEAVVCIPTFRRPEGLARLLRSLQEQQDDVSFAVVVVENDAQNPVGAKRAEAFFATTDLPSVIAIEPKQGNCHAINRAFFEARQHFPTAQYLLMADDDEVVTPAWLSNMVGTARRTGAAIVGGPVIRQFEIPVPRSISEHSLNGYIAGPTRQVPVIHGTGNCLIQRDVFSKLDSGLFDPAFNFLGGGDMDFFQRCRAAGFTFWWCEEAVIHETVAKDRATAAWLLRRSIRTGSINYIIDRKRATSGIGVFLLQGKNLISLGLGVVRSLTKLLKTGNPLIASHPILMSVGRMAASLGFLPAPYKASAIPTAEPVPGHKHDGQLIKN